MRLVFVSALMDVPSLEFVVTVTQGPAVVHSCSVECSPTVTEAAAPTEGEEAPALAPSLLAPSASRSVILRLIVMRGQIR